MALADLAYDKRRDDSRCYAQARLGEPKAGILRGDHYIAYRGKPRAASQRGAMDAPNDGMPTGGDGAKHIGHTQRVVDILVMGVIETGAHPIEVGSRAEARAIAGKHARADVVVAVQLLERFTQLGDELLVERVVDFWAGESHTGGKPAPLDTHEREGPARPHCARPL